MQSLSNLVLCLKFCSPIMKLRPVRVFMKKVRLGKPKLVGETLQNASGEATSTLVGGQANASQTSQSKLARREKNPRAFRSGSVKSSYRVRHSTS